jgi:hypothetical protein
MGRRQKEESQKTCQMRYSSSPSGIKAKVSNRAGQPDDYSLSSFPVVIFHHQIF